MPPMTAAVLITGILITLMPAENNLSKTPRRKVPVLQTCLQALHLAPKQVDGWPGPRTKTALEHWSEERFGAEWEQQAISAIATALEAECHAALYKSEVPMN